MKKIFVLLTILIFATNCVSEILTFEFTGSVSSIDKGYGSTVPDVSIGQPVIGTFSYDTSVPGVIDPLVNDRYNYDQTGSLEVSVGDIVISHINEPVEIDVDNDAYNIREERYEDHFYYRLTTTVAEFGPDDINCDVRFLDNLNATAFDSFELPTSFDLSDFDIAEFYFHRSIEWFTVHCQIDQISLVPEPVSIVLFSLGGLLLRKRV